LKEPADASNEHQLFNDVVERFDKHDYIEVAKGLNITVPGFTKKNLQKAPLHILKNKVKQRLNKIQLDRFLKEYVGRRYSLYEGLSVHEFIVKTDLDDGLTEAKKLALFGLLFPDRYAEQREAILKNVESGAPFYLGLFEPSLADRLTTLAASNFKSHHKELVKIVQSHPMKETWPPGEGLTETESLKEWIERNLPAPFTGIYLKILTDHYEEWEALPLDEKSAFERLAFYDAVMLGSFLLRQNETLTEEKATAEAKLMALEEELNEARRKNEALEKRSAEQDKALGDAQAIIARKEAEIKRLKTELADAEAKLRKQGQELKDLKSLFEESRRNTDVSRGVELFSGEPIVLLSKVDDPHLRRFFNKDQFFILKDFAAAESLLASDPDADDKVYFINTDGLSTKLLFKLEKRLKEKGWVYRLVSNGPKAILRRISYYLEGELEREIEETH
jgi:uncharacterized coiled-coil protein SlyX